MKLNCKTHTRLDKYCRIHCTVKLGWNFQRRKTCRESTMCYECKGRLLAAEVTAVSNMTVRDVILHLQTMPPDMEVWHTWDESGEYSPCRTPQGRIDRVVRVTRRGRLRWEESDAPGVGKEVCVLLPISSEGGTA